MKIMFVCTGNICRSPLAEAIFRSLAESHGVSERFVIDSTGTTAYHVGQDSDARMSAVAARHGVRIRHRSKQLTASHLQDFDLVLAMDRSNLREIGYLADGGMEKVRLFRDFDPQADGGAEVPDPYYGGRAGFELVYQIVERTCRSLLSRLLDGVAASRPS